MRFHRLDLNLLVALDALLATRSVTAAARQLHVTQPSMSGSLARLRAHFADDLLQPVGRTLQRTPLGETLVAAVRATLDQAEATVSLRAGFDAAASRRHFRLSASEATVLTLLIDALKDAHAEAPNVSFDLLPMDPVLSADLLLRRELDLSFVVEHFAAPEHPAALVLQDSFTCIVWQRHALVKRRLSLANYLALGHAVTRYGFNRRPGFEQWELDQLGIERRVEVTCTTPALLAPLVVGTQRIATLPSQLARQQALQLPIRLHPPPLPLRPLRIVMQWHRSRDGDDATRWLRQVVLRAARRAGTLPAEPGDETPAAACNSEAAGLTKAIKSRIKKSTDAQQTK